MKALSFLGIFAAVVLFGTTWLLTEGSCWAWDCDCDLTFVNQHLYILIGSIFSLFFLMYSVIYLFKINELGQIQKQEKEDILLDSSLVQTNYTIYQLPSIRLLNKLGMILSLALFAFAYIITLGVCEVGPNCAEACNRYSFGSSEYSLGFGSAAIYFFIFTLAGLLKSYPSKY